MENIIKTLGEERIRTEFNPSNNTSVGKAKQQLAELINILEAHRNDLVSEYYGKSREVMNLEIGEKLRLISIAQTEIEGTGMWIVKALTA